MAGKSLYLEQLKFDPKLDSSFMARLITNPRLIVLAILTLTIAGIATFINTPRELNPEVDIPIVNVITTLPGASPENVEKLVTVPLERDILDLTTVDTVTSTSSNSVSVITVQFISSQDSDQARDLVQEKVDLAKTELPEEASDVTVQKLDFNEQAILEVALTSTSNRISMSEAARHVASELEADSKIREVELGGELEQEIAIDLKPSLLSVYAVTPQTIQSQLAQNNLTFPAGSIESGGLEYTLAIDNELTTIDSIRALPITINNQQIPLGQIADIYYKTKPTNTRVYQATAEGRNNAITLSVFKTDSATITETAAIANSLIAEHLPTDNSIQAVTIIDLSDEIDQSFTDLQSNFTSTILLVFAILALFLGIRQAAIASLSIPLTFLSAFIIMGITGITINFLTLFSLLLALGLVVDDAIVIVQAVARYGKKFNPYQTGLLVFRDFIVPIWTTTITTVWAFVPLLLASGIIGEFIKPIPIVVSATLLSSTSIAVLLNLPLSSILAQTNFPKRVKATILTLLFLVGLGILLAFIGSSPLIPLIVLFYILTLGFAFIARRQLRKTITQTLKRLNQLPVFHFLLHPERADTGIINFAPVADRYAALLRNLLITPRKRYLTYALTTGFVVISIAFAGTGLLKNEFFPKTDSNNLWVNVETPSGTILDTTDSVLATVEQQLLSFSDIESIISTTGRSFDPNGAAANGSNTAFIALTLIPESQRNLNSIELATKLRQQFASFPQASISVVELSGGPPAGADFQANIKGQDLDQLETISTDFQNIVGSIPGTVNISSSLKITPGEIRLHLSPEKLAQKGLSAAEVGSWVRTAISGSEVGKLRFDPEDQDIRLELNQDSQNLNFLQNITLPTRLGSYTLSEIADFKLASSPVSITREDGQRVVRVFAGSQNRSSSEILADFNQQTATYQLPDGYTWDVGGANEENNESVQSIIMAMGASFLLILITMVLQLSSFRRALLVMLVIPLAVAGVFFNFTIFGIALSFPALIGVLALFGIVVNNSIMLIEKIIQNERVGFKPADAIADACSSRLEPIVLTTLTTSGGLLPITISDPLWQGLGGAIIAGLSVSGILILVLLPTVYFEVFHRHHSR